jgi:hypothetical protein
MKKAGFTLGCILLCAVTHAATVNLTQIATNDVDATSLAAVSSDQYLDTALTYSTVIAPASYSGYAFTHWTNSSYAATVYRDVWGRSLNPISFVLLEDTTTTAHYLPNSLDTDADGVPDWYEIEYFGDLTRTAASDGDGDGILLSAEYTGGTHPLYGNSQSEGGVAWADSAMVVVNLAGYSSYTLRSEPAGTVDQSEIVPPSTVVTTLDLSANTSFGYWTLDDLRQQDAWGVALPQLSFTVESTDRVAVAYLFPGDSDSDGVDDAYEQYYYGTLSNDAVSDTDGDGVTLLEEFSGGTHPLYGNSLSEGGVFWADSGLVTVNLAGFSRYTLTSDPSGLVDVSAIMPDGTTITTPDMTQSTFGYWELDGVRQEDPWGVALREVSFVVDGVDRSAVAYLFSGDSDGDGVNDGFEQYYYGTLSNDATSDTDGDGLTLLEEFSGDTNPLYGNSSTEGGVAWDDSNLVVVNLQPFERLENILVDGRLDGFFSPAPALPTGMDVGDFASVASADWDNDGDYDLFVAHEDGLRIFENIGTANNPNFAEVSGYDAISDSFALYAKPVIARGDWNNTGYDGLAIGGNTGTVTLIKFATDQFGENPAVVVFQEIETGSTTTYPTAGDFNEDGFDDLLILLDDGTVRFYANTQSTPSYDTFTSDFLGQPITNGTSLSVGDVDQDGLLDVLASDVDGRIWEFIQQTDGSFLLQSKVWGGSSAGFAAGLTLAAIDFEGDGDLDLVGGLANGALIALRDPRIGRPTGLVATPGGESILLNWNASWQSRIRGYHLYRGDLADGPFVNLAGEIIPLPRYMDTSVTPGAGYFYYTTAISRFFLPGNSEPLTRESLPSDFATVSAGEVTLSLRPIRGRPNKYVKVKLSIDNAMDIRGEGMQLNVLYDPAVIVPAVQADAGKESVLDTGLSKNLNFSDNGATANGTLSITGISGTLDPGSGKLFTLQFKVNDSASFGTQSAIAINSGTLYTTGGYPVIVLIDGPTTIEVADDYIAGDVDGSGVLDDDDAALLKQLSKKKAPEPTAAQLAAGDLNGDGRISQKDVVLLKRLLRGLD